MAEKQEYFWELPPLSAEDQKLRDAYVRVGKPVDQLPYTEAFDKLVTLLGAIDSPEERFKIFQRLLLLRKRGRLPRMDNALSE
jgi:hypothetical protein